MGWVFSFKSRDELAALPENERLRYLARGMWLVALLALGFALQLAFVNGFPDLGLIVGACAILCLPCALALTLLARRTGRPKL
jgi:hypothetical protein